MPVMSKIIRKMALEDIDMVVEIEKQCFSTPWSREAFENELEENELAHYFVAEIDGLVVGYAGMWIILDEAHVTNVAVLPGYRNMKLGLELMNALIEFSRSNRVSCMTLEVRRSNLVAQKLYGDLGFVPRGLRRQYYTDTQEDAIIMWLDNIA